MNKLFGSKKKKEEPVVNPNAPTLTETSEKVSQLIIAYNFIRSLMKEARLFKPKLMNATSS